MFVMEKRWSFLHFLIPFIFEDVADGVNNENELKQIQQLNRCR